MLLQFPESKVENHLRIGLRAFTCICNCIWAFTSDVYAKPRNCAYKHTCK